MSETADIIALRQEIAILRLAVPLEEELSAQIDEMLKYLAMADGFTLNGVARLLVNCQRRLASDWTEIGNQRRAQNARSTALAVLVTQWRQEGDWRSQHCADQLAAVLAPRDEVDPSAARSQG